MVRREIAPTSQALQVAFSRLFREPMLSESTSFGSRWGIYEMSSSETSNSDGAQRRPGAGRGCADGGRSPPSTTLACPGQPGLRGRRRLWEMRLPDTVRVERQGTNASFARWQVYLHLARPYCHPDEPRRSGKPGDT